MKGDYQLVFVTSDEALCAVGSGLHKVFATKMEDLFISFGPKYMQAESGAFGLETAEILRVFGPFPNIRNTFAGDFACGLLGWLLGRLLGWLLGWLLGELLG